MTTALHSPKNKRSLPMSIVAAQEAFEGFQKARNWYRERTTFTLRVPSDDPLYPDVHTWLLTLMPEGKRRALLARTTSGPRDGEVQPDGGDKTAPGRLSLTSYDSTEQQVIVDGHKVLVVVITEDTDGTNKSYSRKPDMLLFTCRNAAAQNAVASHLARLLAARSTTRRPVIRLLNTSWGSWNRLHDLPPRPLNSVVLADGQIERIVADLGAFLDQEEVYTAKAIPWHRGYMLHGPPGGGKTSLVKALAGHFGLDLWYVPLGDVKDDTDLLNLLSQVHSRSLLLLEDADVFAATREREHEEGAKGLTLSGLLNALDGVATPHGLVTFIGSNKPDVFDSALIRPGRMDVIEEIGLPDDRQVERMFEAFYGEPAPYPLAAAGRSAAAVSEVLKRAMFDPCQAAMDLAPAALQERP